MGEMSVQLVVKLLSSLHQMCHVSTAIHVPAYYKLSYYLIVGVIM